MGNLTASDVLQLIETSSLSPLVPVAGANGKSSDPDQFREESAVSDLHRKIAGNVISPQLVDVLVEASRTVAFETIADLLRGIPNDQPLDDIDLGRIQNALERISAVVKRGSPHVFSRIKLGHGEAVSEIASIVSNKLSMAIRGAMKSFQSSNAGTAS